jgi:hypothetical protein
MSRGRYCGKSGACTSRADNTVVEPEDLKIVPTSQRRGAAPSRYLRRSETAATGFSDFQQFNEQLESG